MTKRAWLIRAGRSGEREQWALQNGLSGGGFWEVPDLTTSESRDALNDVVRHAFVGEKDGKIQNFAAQLWALRASMEIDDLVVMPLKSKPALAIGRISGAYSYRSDSDASLRHVRPVNWASTEIPRTAVKQDLLYSLGAFLTICQIKRNDAAFRLEQLASAGSDPGARPSSAQPGPLRDNDPLIDDVVDEHTSTIDVQQYALDRLSSTVIERFAGYKMQDLVAAVLEAEGYTCKVPSVGPDQGVDVLAGTGPLGLDEPRLLVQVKSEAGSVGSPVVQQLLGAMSHHQAHQGLLVAWGGLTKAAENLLANQYFRVRVWTSQELLEAIFRNYRDLPEEIRSELPLKQVWTLVEDPG